LNKGSKILYILTGTGLKDPVVIGTFLGIKDRNSSEEVITSMSDTKRPFLTYSTSLRLMATTYGKT